MGADAYLAFAPADEAAAREIAAELARHGWTVTPTAPEHRLSAHSEAMRTTVSAANLVVLTVSPAAEAADWIANIAAAAHHNGRPLIVAQTGPVSAAGWPTRLLDLSTAIDFSGGVDTEPLARLVDAARRASARARVIAVLGVKGGVGKTTLAANLFAAAHLADRRAVRFIDLDPQHGLTQYFLASVERTRVRDEGRTLLAPLAGAPGDVAVPLNRTAKVQPPRFDLVCGDERLFDRTLAIGGSDDEHTLFARFRALIASMRQHADAVVIDTGPGATVLTRLAISVADHIVVPVRPDRFALSALTQLEQVVRYVRGRPLKPEEFSVLLNGVRDKARAQGGDVDALVRAAIAATPFFGPALLDMDIPHAGVLRAAPTPPRSANPINATAMMRLGARDLKEALARGAAAILKRARP